MGVACARAFCRGTPGTPGPDGVDFALAISLVQFLERGQVFMPVPGDGACLYWSVLVALGLGCVGTLCLFHFWLLWCQLTTLDLLRLCLQFGLRKLLDPPAESVSGDLRGWMEV